MSQIEAIATVFGLAVGDLFRPADEFEQFLACQRVAKAAEQYEAAVDAYEIARANIQQHLATPSLWRPLDAELPPPHRRNHNQEDIMKVRLRDIDNRDDQGAPYEVVTTLSKAARYIDGPVRRDLTDANTHDEALDQAIADLTAENIAAANRILNQFSVYITEVS